MTLDLAAVPTLSLTDYSHGAPEAKAAFCDALYQGLTRYGFIILKDHSVDTALLEKAYDLSAAFFALPDADKHAYICKAGQRGYTPFGTEHAKDSPTPDLKEFWHVGRETFEAPARAADHPENVWPADMPAFKETFLALFDALDATGRLILEALTPRLDVASDFFEPIATDGNSILRLLHYPPLRDDVPEGAVRAAAHEDINLITILAAASASGLELLDRDGAWLPVETDRNNLVVDAGDMLARLTNDVIPATTHRVVNPKGPNVSRYSMPFFMHPNSDAMLSCLPSCKGDGAKYPDITAGAFLQQRLREIGLMD
ncbi:MAG: 2-oxoglutarate and iron-dependent oxygenase domain-containing protein [Pseudomonadota bacterium]